MTAEQRLLTFLLGAAELSGEGRLVATLADALIAQGHRVRIVTDASEGQFPSRAEWVEVEELRQYVATGHERVLETNALPIAVADAIYRPRTPSEQEPPRVLLAGSWHVEAEGVADGYGAVAHARWFHQKLDLIRVSPWAPSREEPLESVQEFHVGLTIEESARLLHSCDVLVAPDHRDSRRGLFVAEAMAAGLPCVLTAIPAFRSLEGAQDYALFAPEDNAVELGEKLIELLDDFELRERLRGRGRVVAERWRAEHAIGSLLA